MILIKYDAQSPDELKKALEDWYAVTLVNVETVECINGTIYRAWLLEDDE